MSSTTSQNDASTLQDYLRIVRRRKAVVIALTLLGVCAALAFALARNTSYGASSEVLLVPPANTVSQSAQSADRIAQTEAAVAGTQTVAAAALRAAHVGGQSAKQLLRRSTVTPVTGTNLLKFEVREPKAATARRLAAAYAQAYTTYRRKINAATIELERQGVLSRLRAVEQEAQPHPLLIASLRAKDQRLRTLASQQTANAVVVGSRATVSRLSHHVVRYGIAGLGIGLILGMLLAFLLHALAEPVQTAGEVARELQLPLLGRLRRPSRKARKRGALPMIAAPTAAEAEPFRVVRTNIDFFNLEAAARTIMVTSALDGEGKSTTAANLAVAFARAGRRVGLVDFDLRRPTIGGLFGVNGQRGVCDVARGRSTLANVLVPVDVASDGVANGERARGSQLLVVPAGEVPEDVAEICVGERISPIFDELLDHADLVFVDAPPLLDVGDARELSRSVDAMVVVTSLRMLRRPMLPELAGALATCPCHKLGFVLTSAELELRRSNDRSSYSMVVERAAHARGRAL